MTIRQALRAVLRALRTQSTTTAHPNGHFYSPVVDSKELALRLDELYPAEPSAPGIDFNEASHLQLIETGLARYMPEYDYPEHGAADGSLTYFYTQNSQFSWLDARALFCFLRLWQPKRVVEVGSGYSSLLISDIKRRFLPTLKLQCIEPFPRPFLHRSDLGLELIEQRVQAMPLSFFTDLEAGDVLFIDSSHVCKTGSDVNYLFLKILPLLRPGVKIHVHDIFLPQEYLREWVIDENRSWNEQYLLQALLMFSSGFKVLFGSYHAFSRYPEPIKAALNERKGHAFGGCSFYLERI
jgi:predicted O-methyltransferase YrrM